jgi:hypothetical protein
MILLNKPHPGLVETRDTRHDLPMTSFATVLAITLGALAAVSAQQAADPAAAPNAAAILQGARMAATLTTLDEGLSGNLKKDGKTVPVVLFLKGKDIQFQFAEVKNTWQGFSMQLNEAGFDLEEVINGKRVRFPAAKLTQPIAGTDVTYEDLAMRFFYWPNPKLEGVENFNGEDCYKIRVDKPTDAAGRYATVYIWVHRKYGAFMQIKGYDKGGGLAKEFVVQELMPVTDKIWSLKKMQISTHDPANQGRRLSITNLVFDSPRKTKPKGLH